MNEIERSNTEQEKAIRYFLSDCLSQTADGQSIDRILCYAAKYFDADRAYIFEMNALRTTASTTYEWCREGVMPQYNSLPNIPSAVSESWIELLEEKGEFSISSLSEEYPHDSLAYRVLKPQGIESLLVVPLTVQGRVVGLAGVDNPRKNTSHTLLLSVIASICCSELENLRLKNTNKAMSERMNIIQSMSEIYTSVYYIMLADNSYVELASIDSVHNHISAVGNAQENLNYFCRNMMTEEFTAEMLKFVNLSTLDERMQSGQMITKEFLCTVPFSAEQPEVPYWAQCSFIEGGRDERGRLSRVIFATQTIHAAKVKEIEAQKALQNTNNELFALLEEEKRHNAIIGSMSSVFFSLFYINPLDDSVFEIFSLGALDSRKNVYGSARELMEKVLEAWVKAEYISAMRSFVDLDTVIERLGDMRIITQEFASKNGGWIRCCIFPAKSNDEDPRIIFGMRDITAEKEAKVSQDNVIQALSMSYENVYSVSMDTGKAKICRIGQDMKARYGQEFSMGSYEQNIRLYIENEVLEADRSLFSEIRTLSGVKAVLADKQMYSFIYRVSRGGEVEYFECQLVRPDRKRSEFIAGFKNIDEEKKQELAQQQKVAQALAAVEKLNETLMDETEISAALSREYPDVVLLDFSDDTATTLKRKGKMIPEHRRVQRRSYKKTWDYYINKYVLEEDRAALQAAVEINTVQCALKDEDEYVCGYRVKYDNTGIHYLQASFLRMYSRGKAESQIILGFRNIDEIVEEERKSMMIQAEQLRIIDALSKEYHSLFKIDAKTGTLTLYRTDGKGMEKEQLNGLLANGSYEQVISAYIDNYVAAEDRERMRGATSLEVLWEQVPDGGLYKLNYRREVNGAVSYYEMNVAKTIDDSGTVTFIIGLRDVNAEMQRRLKQAREIEAQSEIIEGIGSEYYSVLLVDLENDRVTPYRAQGEDGRDIAEYFRMCDFCWSKGVVGYAEEMVSENSRSELSGNLSLERLRQGGENYSFTYEKLTKHGIVYLQARVAFVREKNGTVAGVIGTRNVDDLIKREREQEIALKAAYDAAEAANKAKTDFLSNMSHDIRTPMNGIIGMTAIAATHIDDKERVQDSLKKITQASKHLLSLINEVLDMSKIESGKVELNEEEFNLSDLVDNLLLMTNSQIEEHHHELSVNISGVVHEEVIGDSLRIQKVFTNLMSNCVKYTPDGGKIRLSISEKPSDNNKFGCYEFIFEDNGIGMSREYINHIFEPFSRAADERVNRITGTGLGMPISLNIVHMMGGDIKVESVLGVGSKFTVVIFLRLQDSVVISSDKFVDLRVLVADDDPLSLESCCTLLDDFGMKATGVSSGAEAVEKAVQCHSQNNDYFACIIDWKMPEMDGIATARAIRRAVGNELPIIIISAYDWSEIEQEARAAGANAFISKPMFRSKLVKTFNALVDNDEPQEKETSLISGLAGMELNGSRVLVVEDNDLNAEIASEILGMTGLTVERAADGIEAVDMITRCGDWYYDIIFMDIQMPKMNGYDTTRAIRAMKRSYCKQVPIIAMTANAFAEDIQAAKTVGMNEHIAKPLDIKQITKTLNKWLRK